MTEVAGVQIKTIEPIAVSLPMRKPVIMAGEEVRRADNVLVRIEADNGLVGWGEAASAPVMTGDTLESLVSAVHYLTACCAAVTPPTSPERWPRWTAACMATTAPRPRSKLPCTTWPAAPRQTRARIARRKKAQPHPAPGCDRRRRSRRRPAGRHKKKIAGVPAYKIKVGIDTPENDAARTREICKVLGDGMLISADANQGYSVEEALTYVRAVNGSGLDFFEQPVAADELTGMAKVAAATDIAIGADEGIHSLDDIRRHHDSKAARGVSLKAIKLGGIRAVTRAGELCDSLGMSVNISCKTGESSVACAAALHVASVIPDIGWALTLTHFGLAEDVAVSAIPTAGGHVDILDRPGLGVDVDEDRVRHHRVAIATRNVA